MQGFYIVVLWPDCQPSRAWSGPSAEGHSGLLGLHRMPGASVTDTIPWYCRTVVNLDSSRNLMANLIIQTPRYANSTLRYEVLVHQEGKLGPIKILDTYHGPVCFLSLTADACRSGDYGTWVAVMSRLVSMFPLDSSDPRSSPLLRYAMPIVGLDILARHHDSGTLQRTMTLIVVKVKRSEIWDGAAAYSASGIYNKLPRLVLIRLTPISCHVEPFTNCFRPGKLSRAMRPS